MNTRTQWVEYCLGLSETQADLYSGCRKILRGQSLRFLTLDDSLQLEDAGFTDHKMRYLERAYLHEESQAVAVDLWTRRRVQDKYGSVGVTCYNHFVKGASEAGVAGIAEMEDKKSKRASLMGPCIQAFTVTYLSKTRYAVDVFYRTTELLKKFAPDLVFLRDRLLEPFDFTGMRMEELHCHFANVTIHPMYFVTVLPLVKDPVAALSRLRAADPYFHDWCVKWTARYICPEFHRGIAKFAQALRVQKDARERLDPLALGGLQRYIRENHPPLRTRFPEAAAALEQDVSETELDEESEDAD